MASSSAPEEKTKGKKEVHTLGEDEELRFEVVDEDGVLIEVLDGQAEIFGTEICQGNKYKFHLGAKIAVYTFHGAKISSCGSPDTQYYVSNQTPMRVYLNTHAALEQMRQTAIQAETRGPRVMVCGPTDVGKSTLCRLLVNYATRLGHMPVYVDLDVGQSDISIPGTLGALVVERPADVEEGFAQTSPLVFHYGHKSPEQNTNLYNMLISRLAEVINTRWNTLPQASTAGCVINTCGWIRGDGYRALIQAAGAFEVDVIVVLDHERLHTDLSRSLPDFVRVLLHPKSGGVVERSSAMRVASRDTKIREYFYGLGNTLFPHTFEVDFSDIKVFKIGAPTLPDSMLPLGAEPEDNSCKLVPVSPGVSLVHRVVSISAANSVEDDIVATNVVGFIVITAVNPEKEVLTVLSPCPRPLPRHILLVMDDIQFMEIR